MTIKILMCENEQKPGVDPARKLRGAISVIFGSQVSVGSQVSFRIVQNHGEKSYFRSFRGGNRPPPWIRPCIQQGTF